ncbi:MAG: hypothetical protein A2Z07_08260 [Armatimonadetes bacterium RBG_16_67_12]|nr:MAG: hypothetical protein A2Z07_08260 [Armatimonadetes bacterium RBG_16_67_12]
MTPLSALLRLAWNAPFYRRRWGHPPAGDGGEALSSLPVVTPGEWQAAIRRDPSHVLVGTPGLWTLVTCAGHPVWTPVAHGDIAAAAGHAADALRRTGIRDGDRIAAVLPAAPSSWNALSYLVVGSDLAVEFLSVSLETVRFKLDLVAFPFAQRLDALLTSRRAAEELAQISGPLPAVARTVFYSDGAATENLDVDLLAVPGCLAPIGRCRGGAWHLDPGVVFAEILTADDRAGRPAIHSLATAPSGVEGTLLVTSFTHAAPLVRLDTGLRARAPLPAPCPCGDAWPRVLLADLAVS